ncbi:MAG: hypothetical protein ABSE77_17105 [Acidimicrobiales bacterium]|jgi:hypothetical protein
MFRIPPPAIAMRLVEEHRHDLEKAAGERLAGGPSGFSPRRRLRSFGEILAKFARWRDAAPVRSSVAATAAELG